MSYKCRICNGMCFACSELEKNKVNNSLHIVDKKYLEDNSYRPYCLRCRTMYRMEHTDTGWKCGICGAIHESDVNFK